MLFVTKNKEVQKNSVLDQEIQKQILIFGHFIKFWEVSQVLNFLVPSFNLMLMIQKMHPFSSRLNRPQHKIVITEISKKKYYRNNCHV